MRLLVVFLMLSLACLCHDTPDDQSSGRSAGDSDFGAAVVGPGIEYREPRGKTRQRLHGIGLHDSRFRGCRASR